MRIIRTYDEKDGTPTEKLSLRDLDPNCFYEEGMVGVWLQVVEVKDGTLIVESYVELKERRMIENQSNT